MSGDDAKDQLRIIRALREAQGYAELELHEKALAVLESIGDFGPFAVQGEYLTAETLRELERYPQAAARFERLVGADPASVPARVGLAWCLKRMGRLNDAIIALDELYRQGVDDSILPFNLACYWALAGDADRAIELLEEAIEADSKYVALARADSDFDAIRNLPEFRRLVPDTTS